MKNVLLICGGGASSGFMAASMRKAAKKRKMDISVVARSEAELDERIDSIDVLFIGPHLSYMENEIKEKVKGKDILVKVIPQSIYGPLDGNKTLDLID